MGDFRGFEITQTSYKRDCANFKIKCKCKGCACKTEKKKHYFEKSCTSQRDPGN